MKKLIVLIALVLLACAQEPVYIDKVIVPEVLEISQLQGIKLESYIVNDQVSINAKTITGGYYRIKIFDFSNRLVSQERIKIEDGDNILNVYVSALPQSSYTIQLHKDNNELIGKELFSNERN